MEVNISEVEQSLTSSEGVLFYLFCITEKIEEIALPNADFPLLVWEYPDFQAIYCQVPTDMYSEEVLLEKLQDWAWLAEQAQKHERVISFMLEQAAVIPFKFGTIFKKAESLEQLLIDKETYFQSTLEQIKDKEEWGVKIFFKESESEALLHDHPDLLALTEQIENASAGKRYMLNKKKGQLVEELKFNALDQIVQSVYQKIIEVCNQSHLSEKNLVDTHNEGEVMVLNGAFLIDKTKLEEFHLLIETVSEEIEPKGLFIEYSGPWAPYHFIGDIEKQELENE